MRRVRRFLGAVPYPAPVRYARWLQYFPGERRAALYTDDMTRAVGRLAGAEMVAPYFAAARDVVDAAMAADVETYLPGDLMTKVDIVSMANGLEVRSPFLDHHLMEFAARLPTRFKLRGGVSKRVLKRACADLLPPAIRTRAKMGFGVPIGAWFRGVLRPVLEDMLLRGPAPARGLFRPGAVRRLVDEHVSGRGDHAQPLWNLLMLELWSREFLDRTPVEFETGAAGSRVA
jgi:asparagine synthase (glutamine-hydrolysing)